MCKIFTLKLELLIFYLFPLLLPSWRASPSSVVDRVPSLPELLVQPSLLAERRLALVRHASRPSWVLQLERLLVLRRRPDWEINLNLFMCMSQRTATTIAQWGGTPSSLIERNWEFLGAKLFLVNKRSALVFLVCVIASLHIYFRLCNWEEARKIRCIENTLTFAGRPRPFLGASDMIILLLGFFSDNEIWTVSSWACERHKNERNSTMRKESLEKYIFHLLVEWVEITTKIKKKLIFSNWTWPSAKIH